MSIDRNTVLDLRRLNPVSGIEETANLRVGDVIKGGRAALDGVAIEDAFGALAAAVQVLGAELAALKAPPATLVVSPTPEAAAQLSRERVAPEHGTVRFFRLDDVEIPSEVIAQRVTRDLGPDSWPEVVRSERATDCPVGLACDPAEIAQRGSCASCGETTEPERR